MRIKTVAVYWMPDGTNYQTCRCVDECAAWRQNDEFIWHYQSPHIKWKIVYRGPEKIAEQFSVVLEAAYKQVDSERLVHSGMRELPFFQI